ncbi:MAG: hypothetical protein A2W23_00520 [Planctomycetes bacterium RBG_16_43_13]|nr:MAG: hypothetical protein A2W23_00520 [Planctomycetes bacterium RBG_16_43_13]
MSKVGSLICTKDEVFVIGKDKPTREEIKLKSGILVWVDGIYVDRNRWISLEGIYNEGWAKSDIERFITAIRNIWHEVPIHILNPDERIKYSHKFIRQLKKTKREGYLPGQIKRDYIGVLPSTWVSVRLKSKCFESEEEAKSLPHDESFSDLVIVWFQRGMLCDFSAELKKRIYDLDWKKFARNYHWDVEDF